MGPVTPGILCGSECFQGPEVGEGGTPDHALIYRGGAATICPARPSDLTAQGLEAYPRERLTTEHALLVTRALATLHADTLIRQASRLGQGNEGHENTDRPEDKSTKSDDDTNSSVRNDTSLNSNNTDERLSNDTHNYEDDSRSNNDERSNDGIRSNDDRSNNDDLSSNDRSRNGAGSTNEGRPLVEPGCVKDRWTAQISRLHVVKSNLTIMVNALTLALGGEERTVRRLEALRSDLPTLTQFLQFASAMQTTRIPSMGPILIRDVWISSQEDEEDVIAIRLRGGSELKGPPLRDASWVWLTLMGGETLRARYTELCDDYCNAFNKAVLRHEAADTVAEMSYFDVIQDLGENFLHSFLTIIHKFVVSGTWFFDRGLHTDEGIQSLVDVISFLVDNGIVGSIFII